jgi:hypothetical protein
MTNNASVLSQDGIATWFQNAVAGTEEAFVTLSNKYGIRTPNQVKVLTAYLATIGQLSVSPPGYETQDDGYGRTQSRWASESLARYVSRLADDVLYAPLARLIFCEFQRDNQTC